MSNKRRKFWLAVITLMVVGAAVGGWAAGRQGREVIELPPLPPEVIKVETVKEIPVEGPERVVEVVRWRTREVPVEREVVREVTRVLCPETGEEAGEEVELLAKVTVDAHKYEGTNEEGKLLFGWKGTAWCQIKEGTSSEWITLANEPFDFARSEAQSTIEPEVRRPFRWRLELRAGLWKALSSDLSDSGWGVGATYYPWRRVGVYANYQGSTKRFIPSYELQLNESRVEAGMALALGQVR